MKERQYPNVSDERLAVVKLALHDMNESERHGCMFALFPARLLDLHLNNYESAALIGLATEG